MRAVNYLKNLNKIAEDQEKEFLLIKEELKKSLERIESNNPYQEKLSSLEISVKKLGNEIFTKD